MRIGILSQWYDPEPGPAAVPGVVARGLRDAGHDVVVLTGFPNYPTGRLADGYRQRPYAREERDGIPVHRVPLYPSHDRSARRRALNYLSFAGSAGIGVLPVLGRVDVAWVYNSPATISAPAALLRLAARVPHVLHVQDLWPESITASGLAPDGRAGRGLARALDAWCALVYRAATKIAVISPGMAGVLERRGVPPTKLSWVPNCADERFFRPVAYDHALADRLGVAGTFTVMYGGSLGDVQSLDTAVRAAALLRDLPAFRLLLVGSGVAESALRALADELRLDNVRFAGRRPAAEMAAIMRVCDVQLVSLRDEPFFAATMPSKIQSVLACGRPAVVAVRGDAAALVEAADAGVTCHPDDPVALATAIRWLHAMAPAERDRLGRNGRAYYERHLSAERLAGQLGDLCAEAVRAA